MLEMELQRHAIYLHDYGSQFGLRPAMRARSELRR
jgi:hypothetical protein